MANAQITHAARATKPGLVSGHVKLIKGKRGDIWYMKFRPPSGRQVQQKLGPAWPERGGTPPDGYFNKKTANIALDEYLADLRRGVAPDPGQRSGKTFGDAVGEWLRFGEHDRDLEETTLADYRRVGAALKEEFGADTPLEQVDEDRIGAYRTRMLTGEVIAKRGGRVVVEREDGKAISRRTAQKRMVLLGGIFKRVRKLKWIAVDPTADIDPITVKSSGDFNVLTVDQIEAVAAKAGVELTEAEAEQYRAAIIVAAYTGLRTGELRALRWRDVDFAGATLHVRSNKPIGGEEKAPKSNEVRSVPLMDGAARALDGLSRRRLFTAPSDRVFVNDVGDILGEDALRDALYAAMEAAGIDRKEFPARGGFVFHDLRHTFGTLAVQVWPLSDVQAYMGHADIQTTMKYVHHVPKTGAAREFTEAVARLRNAGEIVAVADSRPDGVPVAA
jgi:integrase